MNDDRLASMGPRPKPPTPTKPVCLNAGCGKKEVPGFDPYHNRIPYGLLSADEKAALLAAGGPWEWRDRDSGEWHAVPNPNWLRDYIYRAVRRPHPATQEGDIWVALGGRWCFAKSEDEVGVLRAEGWRLYREVKA
jgi:hypothetical protein